MAFQKALATAYGSDANYWRINEIFINRVADVVSLTIEGYASAEISAVRGKPLATRRVNVKLSDIFAGPHAAELGAVWAGLGALGYKIIKEAHEPSIIDFADALDV